MDFQRYGFIKPDGEYIYGPKKKTHDELARRYGFGASTVAKNNDDVAARSEAIEQGWVRFRCHRNCFWVTFNPKIKKAKVFAEKYLLDNPDGIHYEINFKEFASMKDALTYLKKLQ